LLSVFLDKHKEFLKEKNTSKSPTATKLKHQTLFPASNKQKSPPKTSTPKDSVKLSIVASTTPKKSIYNKKLNTDTPSPILSPRIIKDDNNTWICKVPKSKENCS
jgi:hypothetical protein